MNVSEPFILRPVATTLLMVAILLSGTLFVNDFTDGTFIRVAAGGTLTAVRQNLETAAAEAAP